MTAQGVGPVTQQRAPRQESEMMDVNQPRWGQMVDCQAQRKSRQARHHDAQAGR